MALAWLDIFVLIAAVAFGIYLVITGFAQGRVRVQPARLGGSLILLFVSGAASLILAVLAFRHFGQGYAVLSLAIWVGIGFIFRGVATAVLGHQRSDPARPRLVDFRPCHQPDRRYRGDGLAIPKSIVTLALVVGIRFVVIGAFEAASAFGIDTLE